MDKKKFMFSIPAAVAFVLSIASYFLPFFKIKGSDLFGSFGDLLKMSMIEFCKQAFTLSGFSEDMKIILTALLVFLFFLPVLLSLMGAFMSVILKPRAGGVVTIIAGAYGVIAAVLWRVLFNIEYDAGWMGSYSLSDMAEFDYGAIINTVCYVACLALGIVMICTAKNNTQMQAYNQNFQPDNMYQNPGYGNVNYPNQGYSGQGYVNQGYDYQSYNNQGYDNQLYNAQEYNDNAFASNDVYGSNDSDIVTQQPSGNDFEDDVTVRLVQETPGFVTPQAKAGKIICTAGKYKGAQFPIVDGETIIIGRDPKQCNIIVDKDCVYVGRKHCSITYYADNNKYQVCVFSQNGVVLSDGKRIAKGERITLPVGSTIALGNKENVMELR